MRRLLYGVGITLLAACNGSGSNINGLARAAAGSGGQPPTTQTSSTTGCNWVPVFDIDNLNVAFPDTSAVYWLAIAPNIPGAGTRVRIEGRYPNLRYFSFNVYDARSSPTDALADFEIAPDTGGTNPYLSETRHNTSIPSGSRYTAFLEFAQKPESRAPNTMYAGNLLTVSDSGVPNQVGTVLIYRSYVPPPGLNADGGVGLPTLTLETPGGDMPFNSGGDCRTLTRSVTANLPSSNALLISLDYPDGLPGPAFPLATDPPTFHVFYGLGTDTLRAGGAPIPPSPLDDREMGGYFSNVHNRYIFGMFSRNFGGLYLVRARAPTFTDQPGLSSTAQLRYWSICTNEFATQRVVDCVADHNGTIDEAGFYNIVVSDAADRPANASVENGFNWLPWGPYYDGLLIYRNMLPEPSFTQAIQNVRKGEDPAAIMGDYFPVGTYCSRSVFEANAGKKPSAVFAACQAG